MRYKKKYFVIFVIKEKEIYSIVSKKRVSALVKTLRFKKEVYNIDVSLPTYLKDNKLFYFMDVHNKNQLSFEKVESGLNNPQIIDLVLADNLFAQLVSGIKSKMKFDFTTIMLIALGVAIGFIARGFIA